MEESLTTMLHPHTKPKPLAKFEELYENPKKLPTSTKKTELFLYTDKKTKKTVLVKELNLHTAGLNKGNCKVGWMEGNLIQQFDHPNVIRVILLLLNRFDIIF